MILFLLVVIALLLVALLYSHVKHVDVVQRIESRLNVLEKVWNHLAQHVDKDTQP